MRYWLTTLTLTTAIAVSGIQVGAQQQPPLTVQWISFTLNPQNQPIPISINGTLVDSRFPSLSADGRQVVFQVGSGRNAQIWLSFTQDNDGDGRFNEDPIDNIDNDNDDQVDEDPVETSFQLTVPQSNQPLLGIHPIISADGNHIAFVSVQDYGFGNNNRWQIYVLDRLQNRIVPISFLWRDTDGDGDERHIRAQSWQLHTCLHQR
jgi:WD40-like Beta Propeller Repeat.